MPLSYTNSPSDWVRSPTVAGSWYPGDPDELAVMVDDFLASVKPVDGEPLALIVPHAGYRFSGLVTAHGFRQLAQGAYDVAVIVAADHQCPLSNPISIWAEGGFETPLGVVPVDEVLAGALIAADQRITFDPATHAQEHPIEIELPFLQRVCPHCRIVPVLMGASDKETVTALVEALLSVLPGRRAVVIASSDLSHYPRQADALKVDMTTLAAIETGDAAVVRSTFAAIEAEHVPGLMTAACSQGPILVAVRVAQGLGANIVTVLDYANSGDVPYGNPEQVVGYGAVMCWRYDPPHLTVKQRDTLLALARTSIATYLATKRIPTYEANDPILTRPSGVFVTLRKNSQPADGAENQGLPSSSVSLRGCTGRIQADYPLYRAVQESAVAAATADPRFPPLTPEELDELHIEISILSPSRRITDIRQIEIGRHGLLISGLGKRGVLLPQVPVAWGWNQEEFLERLCYKAGLPPDCWPDEATLYTFTTLEFEEA